MEELRDLHPSVVTSHGLDSLAAHSPVRVHRDVAELPRLPETIEVAIYFFVAECLTNVAKYARSGLLGLADRVETLGGRLEVESPEGGGTRVTAHLPVGVASRAG